MPGGHRDCRTKHSQFWRMLRLYDYAQSNGGQPSVAIGNWVNIRPMGCWKHSGSQIYFNIAGNRRSLLQLLAHLQGLYIRQDLWHPNRNFVRHPHSWPHLHHQVLSALFVCHLHRRCEGVFSGCVTLRLCHSRCSARYIWQLQAGGTRRL